MKILDVLSPILLFPTIAQGSRLGEGFFQPDMPAEFISPGDMRCFVDEDQTKTKLFNSTIAEAKLFAGQGVLWPGKSMKGVLSMGLKVPNIYASFKVSPPTKHVLQVIEIYDATAGYVRTNSAVHLTITDENKGILYFSIQGSS